MTLDRRALIISLENDLEQTVDGIGRLGERGKQTLSFKTFNNMRHLDKDGEAGVWLLTGSAKRGRARWKRSMATPQARKHPQESLEEEKNR